MGFLKNVWYASGWADELGDKGPIARTIADIPLVIFRNASGVLSALEDRCPHRFAPLSRGQLTERGIRCGYHGLEFSISGRCVANPHGPLLNSISVRAFVAQERHGMVWVWMGQKDAARNELIPDMSFVDHAPQHALSKGYLPTAANHLLMVDNILDLSHADYLHPDTLGGGSISRTKAEIKEGDHSLRVAWNSVNEVPLPIFRLLLPTPDTRCDMDRGRMVPVWRDAASSRRRTDGEAPRNGN